MGLLELELEPSWASSFSILVSSGFGGEEDRSSDMIWGLEEALAGLGAVVSAGIFWAVGHLGGVLLSVSDTWKRFVTAEILELFLWKER